MFASFRQIFKKSNNNVQQFDHHNSSDSLVSPNDLINDHFLQIQIIISNIVSNDQKSLIIL